jgi:hypothetical protein
MLYATFIFKKSFKKHGGKPPSFGQLLFSHHLFYITKKENNLNTASCFFDQLMNHE